MFDFGMHLVFSIAARWKGRDEWSVTPGVGVTPGVSVTPGVGVFAQIT